MPVNIDGTDITGATIDGTEVTEITANGDVVFTAGFPNTMYGFSNSDLVRAENGSETGRLTGLPTPQFRQISVNPDEVVVIGHNDTRAVTAVDGTDMSIKWTEGFSGNNIDTADTAMTGDGGVVVAETEGVIDPSTVSKFDVETGNVLWRETTFWNGNDFGSINHINATGDGGAHATGEQSHHVRYNSDGSIMWDQSVARGNANSTPRHTDSDGLGGYYISADDLLYKFSDPNGTQEWVFDPGVSGLGVNIAYNPYNDEVLFDYSNGTTYVVDAGTGNQVNTIPAEDKLWQAVTGGFITADGFSVYDANTYDFIGDDGFQGLDNVIVAPGLYSAFPNQFSI